LADVPFVSFCPSIFTTIPLICRGFIGHPYAFQLFASVVGRWVLGIGYSCILPPGTFFACLAKLHFF
jgi:hypothetical protein